MQLLNSFCRRWFRGIKKSQEANQNHFLFITHGEITHLLYIAFLSNGQHSHSFPVHFFADLLGFNLQFIRQRLHFSIELCVRTDTEHLFHGAFGDDLAFPLFVFYHYGHSPADEIERYLVHFGVGILQMFQLQFLYMREDGFVHQIL